MRLQVSFFTVLQDVVKVILLYGKCGDGFGKPVSVNSRTYDIVYFAVIGKNKA